MLTERTENILVKYLAKSVSKEELIELTMWLSEASNAVIFKDFVKTNYFIDANMLDFGTQTEVEIVLQKIKRQGKYRKIQKVRTFFKYAAMLLVFLGIGFAYLNKNVFQKTEEVKTASLKEITPGTNKGILTLEDGKSIVLGTKEVTETLQGRILEGDKLVYDKNSNSEKESIQYNYLTIPKGGQFYVELSDGTKVWLNSDSKLKYPVRFTKGQSREVALIYGEAYFDVSESTKHYGTSFKVKTSVQEVEVLGTEFNIKSYQDETSITTTLVEGKVAVSNGVESKYLVPSEQTLMNIKTQDFKKQKVAKLFDEIAWKQGYFSFKRKPLKEIMKTLSRWYNVAYVFKTPELENKTFTGVLDREISIDKLLNYIQKTNEINYKIDKNTVIIE